jgi:hypothetical protein
LRVPKIGKVANKDLVFLDIEEILANENQTA